MSDSYIKYSMKIIMVQRLFEVVEKFTEKVMIIENMIIEEKN